MRLTSEARAWLSRTVARALEGRHLEGTDLEGGRQEIMSHLHSAGEARAREAGRLEVHREDLEAALQAMGGMRAIKEAFAIPLARSPPRAGLGRRVAAHLLDGAILYGGALAGWITIWVLFRVLLGSDLDAWRPWAFAFLDWDDFFRMLRWNGLVAAVAGALPFLLFLVVKAAYYAIFEGVAGATPGKRALGLRVADARGHPLSPRKGLLRNATKLFPIMFPVIVVDALWIPLDGRRQRASDRVFETVVLDESQATEAGRSPDHAPEGPVAVQRELRP